MREMLIFLPNSRTNAWTVVLQGMFDFRFRSSI